MKGIFLTQEGKQEIEAEYKRFYISYQWQDQMRASFLEEILSSATILPLKESWYDVLSSTRKHKEHDYDSALKIEYQQGVIIQPKQ
jgi:1,2-phenylacetyl-CoA epoxidase catalytic subunit